MPANDSWSVEEITRIHALEALQEEWTALCDHSPRTTPFQRPEWLLPWWRAFPPGEPWVLAIRKEGRLAALAPLLLYVKDGERTVAFCGGGVSDYCDVVTDPEEEDGAITALLAHLAARRDHWEVGDFEPLPGESPLSRIAPPAGIEARTEPRDVCPVLDLPDHLADLGDVVHTRQLANLRKYRRKAEALGELRLETVETRSWEELLEILLGFHVARRTEAGQTGLLGAGDLRTFHREVAAGFHARGALGLYALCLDGRPVAALYGFWEKDTFYFYMQGFDSAWAKLSPGVMVVGGVVEDVVHRGARRLDFLRGREPYKHWWGARDRETFRRVLRPQSSA
ncbi:MAG TPA: GNAT family N-acetyltransferase [Thermoanaerobaculia bacterium]|jgi:CelD/BcsL family acetyltransferase involved in cellulose biosynthesis|nr:GNAT family N-acetyltransferase [Thermoanaerobaculia bacterium]